MDLNLIAQFPEGLVDVGLEGLGFFPGYFKFDKKGLPAGDQDEAVRPAPAALHVELQREDI